MADDPRPDPDALLAQLRGDAQRAARGRLRIYFGSSAGVGKTCAMLLAARRRRDEGVDVLAGVVETHGRSDTAALLQGLPVLLPAQVDYRGRRLAEFDLDGALARRPALVLVDELAHSNVAGSRHPKRWQDVEELLAAGIDVYSTLNVQHLESLNDVVGGITGIVVHETLPDTFFDQADEVVLVDTPAEELMQRLAAGKVYRPAQAERAAKHFFRKGNLMALRELALRRTADRVEDDVQAYRVDRSIDRVWKTEGALLCAIGPHEGAEHVVRSAAQLATQLAVTWHAVYVETPALQRLAAPRREAILRTVKLARDLGASTAVLSGQAVADALLGYARRQNLSRLVLGGGRRSGWWPRPTLADTLARLAPDIDRIELGRPRRERPDGAGREGGARRSAGAGPGAGSAVETAAAGRELRRYGLAVAASALTTVVAHGLMPYFDLANIVMLFLLGVVGVAVWLGRGPSVLAAFVNVAAFDFFFVPPRLSFAVADVQYLLTFVVMLIVALVTGQLTAGLRFQARVAAHREARSRALFEAARDLSDVLTREDAVAVAEAVVARAFRARVAICVLDADDRLQAPAPLPEGLDVGTAQWTLDHDRPAGLGTDTLAGSAWLYLPLKATMRSRGVLALQPREPRFLMIPEQREQLETFAALAALSLERVHCIDIAHGATAQMASERLRHSLLEALSHDLRTPLATLVGTAEQLAASEPRLGVRQQALAASLAEKAQRMADMVTNLLDMARIQSAGVRLRVEWQSVEELVGGAVRQAQGALGARPVDVRIDPDVSLVECDAVLIERVLANLLENAGKYTPAGTPIEVLARAAGGELRVSVRDHGPGVPPGQEERIFEKFTRGQAESTTPGVGLGLAICRAIVEAHGGRIRVEPTASMASTAPLTPTTPRGATFTFSLPLGTPPAIDWAGDLATGLREA